MEGSGDSGKERRSGTSSGSERRSGSSQNQDDPMLIQNSDTPRMSLVTVLLNKSNYLNWSRTIRRALAAKNKLGFFNGEISKPTDENMRSKWKRVDELVCSWIINSMQKEIAETFVNRMGHRSIKFKDKKH